MPNAALPNGNNVYLRQLLLVGAFFASIAPAIASPNFSSAQITLSLFTSDAGRGRHRSTPRPSASPTFAPTVLPLTTISANRAGKVLARFYPQDSITTISGANALVVVAPPGDVNGMRTILLGIDVHNPIEPATEAVQLLVAEPRSLAKHLSGIYPNARIASGPNRTLIITAPPATVTLLKSLIATLDAVSTPSPAPTKVPTSTEAIALLQASPPQVARELANVVRGVRVSVAGMSLVITGSPDAVSRARDLASLLDRPAPTSRFSVIYRVHTLDAQSVADLIGRTYPDVVASTEKDLNAISVTATSFEHKRISDAIQQLDANGAAPGPSGEQPGSSQTVGGGNSDFEVYNLKAAVPGINGAASTSGTDVAQLVTQTLLQAAPDLHINVASNQQQLIISGTPLSIRLAMGLLEKVDVSQKLVVLDTEILEIDRNSASDLGLLVSNPVISSTFSETAPTSDNGTTPRLIKFQPISRTPLSLGAQLNFLVQNGSARVLADPRITTVSGRTATIRAGDTIAIETTAGGGAGTVATTQLQTFQTGVTLDITPVVNSDNFVTVSLHPVVNSETGITNGIPQISTRDTQTTVSLQADQTLIIGGLIQQASSKTVNKLPFLGDIPLFGALFTNTQTQSSDNELVITVTPHIIVPGEGASFPRVALPKPDRPGDLPTLPPGALLPTPLADPAAAHRSTAPPLLQIGAPAILPDATPPTPQPNPSTFMQSNVFDYGRAPTNNYAGPTDPTKIFYAEFTPTVLRNGTPVKLSVATTTNVSKLTLGYGGFGTELSQTGPGQWISTFNFNASQLPPPPSNVNLLLTASRLDGNATSISIPVTIAP